jgi:hypothetical protein
MLDALIGGGTALLGGLLGKSGAENAAESNAAAARYAADLAEKARKESKQALRDERIISASDLLFPGLFGGAMPFSQGGGVTYQPTPLPGQDQGQEQTQGFTPDGGATNIQPLTRHYEALPSWDEVFGSGIEGFRQVGGPTQAGKPYVVGEGGPEIFVPNQPGMVVPNPQMQATLMAPDQNTAPQGQPRRAAENPRQQPTPDNTPGVSQTQPPSNISDWMGGAVGPGGTGGGNGTGGQGQQQDQGGAQAGATATPDQQVDWQQTTPGSLSVAHIMDYLMNPGNLSPVAYQRAQEQANTGLNTALGAIQGGLAGRGVDPSSGLGQQLMQSAALSSAKQRSEAARDYSLAEEQLRRQDIQQGMANYLNFLSSVLGLSQARSAAAAGQAFPQVQPTAVNTNAPLAQGLGTAGSLLANYFAGQGGGGGGTPTIPEVDQVSYYQQ